VSVESDIILIVLALLGVVVFQQIFFLRQIHKLVDKLMSRSFTEYTQAEKPREKPKFLLPTEAAEDLNIIPNLSF
jgi:hypothetical protein